MRIPLRERSFGELIGLCFSVAAGHFGLLFLLAVLLNLPGAVFGSVKGEVSSEPGPLVVVMTLLTFLVVLLTAPLLQAASIRVVAGSFTGEPTPLGDCLRLAVRKMWTLLGYGMVTGVITSLGYLLCIAPGVIFMTWYYLGATALVIEDLGVGRAMARSKAISAGRRWEILGYALVTGFLFQGLSVALNAGLGLVLDPRLAPWVGLPFTSVLSMPLSVAPVVYYFNLRVAREGFDLERLSTLIQSIGEGKPATSAG
jgi:hypothetical protein